jgi:two-component system sensor histidine kinase HydH
VCDILGTDAEDRTIDLSATGEATVRADAGMLRQVLFNLTMNALQAVPEGGRVQVCIVAGGNGTVDIEVIDNGPGVPADQREEVFRPYFTTAADGTGLGLAVVRQIVSAHGWSVRCVAAPGGGACFRVAGITRAKGSAAT